MFMIVSITTSSVIYVMPQLCAAQKAFKQFQEHFKNASIMLLLPQ